mmetsp:Transcript_28598/g.61311  ORF Transcript_28598/g.61311 Transcript_28598/m.61311 type:complete len:201 (+) Transcript_28598:385-987(+)
MPPMRRHWNRSAWRPSTRATTTWRGGVSTSSGRARPLSATIPRRRKNSSRTPIGTSGCSDGASRPRATTRARKRCTTRCSSGTPPTWWHCNGNTACCGHKRIRPPRTSWPPSTTTSGSSSRTRAGGTRCPGCASAWRISREPPTPWNRLFCWTPSTRASTQSSPRSMPRSGDWKTRPAPGNTWLRPSSWTRPISGRSSAW